MRIFRIGTTSFRKTDETRDAVHFIGRVEERFAEAEPLIAKAGKERVDFLCLPEVFATAGMDPQTRNANVESWPGGPVYRFCSNMARKHKLNLITTIFNRRGGRTRNTAVVFDRRGRLAGTYDKIHLPPGEAAVPGRSLPVYTLEGLKLGFQICYDLVYPEACRILKLKGADIVFWPTMFDGPLDHFTDCLMRARAMENLMFLVSSNYIFYGQGGSRVPQSTGPSAIVAWNGFILAQTALRRGLAVAEIDLDEKRVLCGDWNCVLAVRRPDLYGELCRKHRPAADKK